MKFITNVAPSLKQKQSTKAIMRDLTIALLSVYIVSTILYATGNIIPTSTPSISLFGSEVSQGVYSALRIWGLLAVSLIVMFASEALWSLATKKPVVKTLGSSFGWITSLIIVLMCPVNASFFAVGVGTFVAIFFGKLIFGGFGQNIFNPAGLGRMVILSAFGSKVAADITVGSTPLAELSTFGWMPLPLEGIEGGMSAVFEKAGGLTSMLLGTHGGAIGETCIVLLLIIGIILSIRKVIDYRQPLLYLGGIFVFASATALAAGLQDWYLYGLFHLITGGVVFGAVFMLTDPVTNPTSVMGRVIYPLGAAFLTVLIRLNGSFVEGCVISILAMNALTPAIEYLLDGKNKKTKLRGLITSGLIIVAGIGMSVNSGVALAKEREVFAEESKVVPTVSFADKELADYKGTVDSKVDNGDGTITYTVSADGYHSKGDDATKLNQFEIVMESEGTKIKSIKVTVMNDTEYVGDKIENKAFLDSFVGKSLDDLFAVEISDTVSGATYSVRSLTKALQVVYDDMNGGVVTNTTDNADGTKTVSVSAPGYHAKDDPKEVNEFDITVDAEGLVKEVKVTKMADTEYIGDKIENKKFLEGLVGTNLKEAVSVEVSDTVSGATYSVKSVQKALQAVAKSLGY